MVDNRVSLDGLLPIKKGPDLADLKDPGAAK
jgi:hypothetical protein